MKSHKNIHKVTGQGIPVFCEVKLLILPVESGWFEKVIFGLYNICFLSEKAVFQQGKGKIF